ncbi:hypothetical protein PG993_009004 [Apiospora rasikravindrae]|uniref:Uncharacterized protein n=1 Tax=Apiospora rasikravindrae TaxID=990691 RepID=A0ABR1SJX0_9PEZI
MVEDIRAVQGPKMLQFRSELDLVLDDQGKIDGDLELHGRLGCDVEALLATLLGFLGLIQIVLQRVNLLLLLVDLANELQHAALGILHSFGDLWTNVSMLAGTGSNMKFAIVACDGADTQSRLPGERTYPDRDPPRW